MTAFITGQPPSLTRMDAAAGERSLKAAARAPSLLHPPPSHSDQLNGGVGENLRDQ